MLYFYLDLSSFEYMRMTFQHSDKTSFTFNLIRNKIFHGGGIVLKDGKSEVFMTASILNSSCMVESRTEVGNWFIEVIRENWV